jgi:hypothetical protein
MALLWSMVLTGIFWPLNTEPEPAEPTCMLYGVKHCVQQGWASMHRHPAVSVAAYR